MKSKLSLNKQTVDLLDSMNIYGGAGTLVSGMSVCACVVTEPGTACVGTLDTMRQCTDASYCMICLPRTEDYTCGNTCTSQINTIASEDLCWSKAE